MARKYRYDCILALNAAGIGDDDAQALRRISMTLHRWHELECGDGNSYGSWAIERDDNGDGRPFMVHHHYRHGQGKDSVTRTPIADKERGAIRRLEKIMKSYPGFGFYIQGDPRGAALYIMRPGDIPAGESADSFYTRGIVVCK
jgi:hypothetical protein